MLVYDLTQIKTNGFKPIFDFLKETILRFAKPVDFVDYEDCDEDFREKVREDIIWVGTENKTPITG